LQQTPSIESSVASNMVSTTDAMTQPTRREGR
jgi:hypothetical protein